MKLLNNKAGVTVLEGIIALGLLAVVTAGAFGVLASASRKSSQPDMREEMSLAVEKAKDLLQMYTGVTNITTDTSVPEEYKHGLCGGNDNPLEVGKTHAIKCMLPLICDKNHAGSHFNYTVQAPTAVTSSLGAEDLYQDISLQTRKVTFDIACNGYEL